MDKEIREQIFLAVIVLVLWIFAEPIVDFLVSL